MAAEREYNSFLQELQDEGEQDVLRAMIRVVIKELMQEELGQHLQAEPYERSDSRTGHRNGYKPRTLNTRVGKLNFEVPQVRGTDPYRPMFFERWQRSERALLVTCAEMYYMGVSTRKVGRILEEMGGFSLSAATVSKVAAELDEKIEEFRSRTLGDRTWPFLLVDARYEKVRHAGRIVSRAVLVVAGVNDDGQREILTWRLGDSESEQTWTEVFGELKRRGLSGVELVVSDGHEGIRAALQRAFPQAAWQRCRVHFIRNILSKCSHKDRIALINDIRAAFKLTDRNLALETARELAVRWRGKYAKVARQLEEHFEECLAVMEFPTRHRRRLHSTNMLERLMREIKRRTRVVGIFPNEASCDRLVGAMLIEYHESWQGQRARFIRMEEF